MNVAQPAPARAPLHLLKPSEWTARYFAEGSQPAPPTVRKWMRSGAIPAVRIGGSWFVDENAWLAGGDDLVARVLGAR